MSLSMISSGRIGKSLGEMSATRTEVGTEDARAQTAPAAPRTAPAPTA